MADRKRRVLDALAELPTATPTSEELARALGGGPELAELVDALERREFLERWRDPDRPGVIRVMLSTRALKLLGLELDRGTGRWAAIGPARIDDRPTPNRGAPHGRRDERR